MDRLGTLRKRIWQEDYKTQVEDAEPEQEDEEATAQKHTFNTLVKEGDRSPEIDRTRRMRWLSQICEYWPLGRLAAITDEDVSAIMSAYKNSAQPPTSGSITEVGSLAHVEVPARKGTITLAGSGPGHPDLLTTAALNAIKTADFILADKLVPAEVLALIPRRTPVHIARKFPGNADAAQEEMHQLALTSLGNGKNVLRLKQGDPYLYGRGAEEVAFFRLHGFETRVIPGVTSSLSDRFLLRYLSLIGLLLTRSLFALAQAGRVQHRIRQSTSTVGRWCSSWLYTDWMAWSRALWNASREWDHLGQKEHLALSLRGQAAPTNESSEQRWNMPAKRWRKRDRGLRACS